MSGDFVRVGGFSLKQSPKVRNAKEATLCGVYETGDLKSDPIALRLFVDFELTLLFNSF